MKNPYQDYTIYVGIDQSLNSTGYYVQKKHPTGSTSLVAKGTINPKNKFGGERLKFIYGKLTKIFSMWTRNHKVLVCMEGYAYNYRSGKIFELGEVGGIVKLLCALNSIEVIAVPPTELKKFVTGKSLASKKLMMDYTDESQDDIADAKGLSWIAQELSQRTSTERRKLEVIHNCLAKSKPSVPKPKYKRPHKSNRIAAEVLL